MTRMQQPVLITFVLVTLTFAGCVGGGSDGGAASSVDPVQLDEDGNPYLLGLVVDSEFFPISNATVGLIPDGPVTTTGSDGSFQLGPLPEANSYEVYAEREGFQGLVRRVEASDLSDQLVFSLDAVPGREPYHETVPHVGFIECAWAVNGLGTLPCNPVDRTLGTSLTVDNSQYFFEIPAPDLVQLRVEAMWDAHLLGRDMRFLLFKPDIVDGAPVGGDTYLDGRGGSPYRTWLTDGVPGTRADEPFDGNETTLYQALYRPWATNSTVPNVAIFVNHRVENFYTFFYHREGPPRFSAMPDQ